MPAQRSWWSLSMVGWVNIGEVSCGSVEVGRSADVVVVGGQRAFEGLVERARRDGA